MLKLCQPHPVSPCRPRLSLSALRFPFSSYDWQHDRRTKETGKFTFPKELDMRPFCMEDGDTSGMPASGPFLWAASVAPRSHTRSRSALWAFLFRPKPTTTIFSRLWCIVALPTVGTTLPLFETLQDKVRRRLSSCRAVLCRPATRHSPSRTNFILWPCAQVTGKARPSSRPQASQPGMGAARGTGGRGKPKILTTSASPRPTTCFTYAIHC